MTDSYNRTIDYLRLSVTDRCNLRCIYCMPSKGVQWVPHGDVLRFEEIVHLVRLLSGLGIRRVRLTGGEPLVREGILDLAAALHALPGIDEIHLTTNGVLFAPMADPLRQAGIHGVNFSLDTLQPDIFRRITRTDQFAAARAGIDKALEAGFPSVKVNCVLMRGINDGEAAALASLAKDAPLEVRFIEMMPIGCGRGYTPVPTEEVYAALVKSFGKPNAFTTPLGSGPAVYVSFPAFQGHVGFISAMTHVFCARCNRVRLTAEGYLKPCLHNPAGTDLCTPLRTGMDDAALTALLRRAIEQKPARHHFTSCQAGEAMETRTMNAIGG